MQVHHQATRKSRKTQLSQISRPGSSFPSFCVSHYVLSLSPALSHKGSHCSWQNLNLVEIESRCGSAFSSRGAGVGGGCRTFSLFLVCCFPWRLFLVLGFHWVASPSVWAAWSLSPRVTHSLPLFILSISQPSLSLRFTYTLHIFCDTYCSLCIKEERKSLYSTLRPLLSDEK